MSKEYEPQTVKELTDMVNSSLKLWGMSDEAYAYWDAALAKVSETDQWKTDYLEKNKLIGEYRNAADATAYVTEYEADYMAANGIH